MLVNNSAVGMGGYPRHSILFVCLGNICRSPLAEGVFRHVAEAGGADRLFRIDSAGTGAWHAGSPPDPRSIAIANRHGIDISQQRARRIEAADLTECDHVLGMDRSNVDTIRNAFPAHAAKVHLYLDFALRRGADIPDPYHGGAQGFADVYRTIREASEALLARLTVDIASRPVSGQASSTT